MRSSAALDFAAAGVVPVELAVEGGAVDVAHQPRRDHCDRLVCSPMTRLATWRIAPSLALDVVVTTRVYVGAHSPLDVVCGAAPGLAIGGGVKLLLGVPEPSR